MQDIKFDLTSHRVTVPSVSMELLYWEHRIKNGKIRGNMHFHDHFQAEFIIKGTLKACFEDQEISMDNNTILMIPPGIRHNFEYEGSTCEYYSFKFNSTGGRPIKRPLLFSDPRNIMPLKHYIAEFMSDDEADKELVSVHMRNALKTLIELEYIYNKKIKPKTIAERVRSLILVTDGYYPTADEIAGQMDLSRPYLSQKLKEETGYSLKPFLDKERICHAETLLHLSDLSISEISYHLGFSDIWGFSKFFRRMTGISPSDYRAGCYI